MVNSGVLLYVTEGTYIHLIAHHVDVDTFTAPWPFTDSVRIIVQACKWSKGAVKRRE